MLRIFTVEYDSIKKTFDDSALAAFPVGKSVISIEKRFFKQNPWFFWTFAIEYETDKKDGSKDLHLETDGQKGLFLVLREWRNELAAEKGGHAICYLRTTSSSRLLSSNPKRQNS